MKIYKFLVFFLALAGSAFGQGATPSTPLPPGDLIKRAPDFSSWTVVAKTGGGSTPTTGTSTDPKKTGIIRQAAVTKTGRIIYEQVVNDHGRKFEIWHSNGVQILIPAGGASPLIFPDFGGGDIYTPNYAVSDFAGLDWVSSKTYTGMQRVMGRDCIIFQGEVNALAVDERQEMDLERGRAQLRKDYEANKKAGGSTTPGTEPPANERMKVQAVACIDLETRLPLVVTFGKETRTYTYGPPPVAMLKVPDALAAALTDFQNRIQGLARLPATP